MLFGSPEPARWSAEEVRRAPEPVGEALDAWIVETMVCKASEPTRFEERMREALGWSPEAKEKILALLPHPVEEEAKESPPMGRLLSVLPLGSLTATLREKLGAACECASCSRERRVADIHETALRLMEADATLTPAAAVARALALEAACRAIAPEEAAGRPGRGARP